MVDKHGIGPDPDAVEAVLTWKLPKTEHQLMSFLGFANYYREFIKGDAPDILLSGIRREKDVAAGLCEGSGQETIGIERAL